MGITDRRHHATGTGFTLIELVLTVVLLLLLAGAAAFNFNSAQRGAQLEEGAGQLESLFRYARAQAAGTGRRVLVRFGSEMLGVAASDATNAIAVSSGIRVLWEPEPLTEPGKFVPLPEAAAFAEQLNELVRFEATPPDPFSGSTNDVSATVVAVTGDEAAPAGAALAPFESPPGGTNGVPAAIVFYADGSSDSADFLLASVEPEDHRRVRLILAGLTGMVRRKWIAPESDAGRPAWESPADFTTGTDPSLTPSSGKAAP
jgi:type II secretory pathway pseudopilin PulG